MVALLQKLKAAEALTKLGHLEAKPHLSQAELHQLDKCIASLIAIGEPAVPLLIRRMAKVYDTDPAASVPRILQQIGDAAVPYLVRAMHDKDCHLRHKVISLLGRMATPAAMSALDDDSVDLMDREALQHALLEARRHHQGQGNTNLAEGPSDLSQSKGWMRQDDSLI